MKIITIIEDSPITGVKYGEKEVFVQEQDEEQEKDLDKELNKNKLKEAEKEYKILEELKAKKIRTQRTQHK